ncbi:MAG: TerB family tellurite resistance protein [Cyclobacteriaceae bacterium]|jgi:uncharacterized tellurite resistance protein B-like protein|nr:TerB family tellurite resistance protein [Cyclobacteriaceae bacterium]
MEINTRKLINMLIQLAEADKHFAKVERELILRISKSRQISEETVMSLIRNPEPIDDLQSLTQDQKFEYLYLAIDLIFADHNIFDSEVVFCKNIAVKLGFKKQAIDYFVEYYGKKSFEEFKTVILRDYC